MTTISDNKYTSAIKNSIKSYQINRWIQVAAGIVIVAGGAFIVTSLLSANVNGDGAAQDPILPTPDVTPSAE